MHWMIRNRKFSSIDSLSCCKNESYLVTKNLALLTLDDCLPVRWVYSSFTLVFSILLFLGRTVIAQSNPDNFQIFLRCFLLASTHVTTQVECPRSFTTVYG